MNPDLNTEKPWAPGWFRRVVDFLFGYDFFISYTWSDGRTYSKALAQRLEAAGFECFLDSDDYCKGDDWKKIGSWTLRRTSRLILVGSPNSLGSKPVFRELKTFSKFKRQVIPISFDDSLNPENTESPLFEFLNADKLYIKESQEQLTIGPTDRVVNELRNTFKLMRQAQKRIRFFAVATLLFSLVAAFAVWKWQESKQLAVAEKASSDAATDALQKQLEMITTPLAVSGKIAAVTSNPYLNPTSAAQYLEQLKESPRPIASSKAILHSISKLSTAVGKWNGTQSDDLNRAGVQNSVLNLAATYRNTLQDLEKQLHPQAAKLLRDLSIGPAYQRAIVVSRALASDPENFQNRAEFESLYWSELVLVENQGVENAMIQFRRHLMVTTQSEKSPEKRSMPGSKQVAVESKGHELNRSNINKSAGSEMIKKYQAEPVPVSVNRSKLKELAGEIKAACLKSVPTLVVPDEP